MVKALMMMHNIARCTSYIAFMLVSHTCIFALDPAELELEEPTEQSSSQRFHRFGSRQALVHLTNTLVF
jgi:hypothetical protein